MINRIQAILDGNFFHIHNHLLELSYNPENIKLLKKYLWK